MNAVVPALAALVLAVLPPQEAPRRDAAPADGAPALDGLAWLAGHWRRESDAALSEELWMPPRGGVMLGLNRSVKAQGRASFEHLRLQEDRDGGVTYWASPNGAAPTPFRLTLCEPGRAVFENPEHDFPKRIEYRLAGDELTASIAGDTPGPSWTWRRVGEVR